MPKVMHLQSLGPKILTPGCHWQRAAKYIGGSVLGLQKIVKTHVIFTILADVFHPTLFQLPAHDKRQG